MTYVENRVHVADFGVLKRNDARLVPVPTTARASKQQLMHWAAAERLASLRIAAAAAGHDILVASGWRPNPWKSREHYERHVTERYGSVREGQKWLAYRSAHFTGLAFDIGSGGLEPRRATISRQKATPLYKWLVAHAHEHGITPYKREPWHWEANIPLDQWKAGVGGPTGGFTTGQVVGVALVLGPILVGAVAAISQEM